jgi:hypothetical protein
MIRARLVAGAEADAWTEKALALAKEAGSNLTFHQLPVPWAWWRHFQGLDGTDFGAKRGRNFLGARSRVEDRLLLVAEDGDALVGCAPLAVFNVTLKTGTPPVRLLGFSADSVTLFYQDLLAAPGQREAAVEAMVDALCRYADEHGVVVFLGHIPEDSPNLPALARAVETRVAQGWAGGIAVNRFRGGVYPWTLPPLGSALGALETALEGDADAKAGVRTLIEKLEKQGPSLLNFRATGVALERDLQALLEKHAGDPGLAEACEAARAAVTPGVIKYPYLRLPGSVEEYQASLSSSRRYYFRRYLGKFEKAGGSIEEVAPERLSERDVEDYLALHRERWGGDSVAVNDSTVDFHRDIAREGARLGVFRLFFARLGERRIAAHACFDVGDRREYFFSGRDPELEELRAGKLLVFHTVLDAVAKGFKTYDFGYGGDEYKSEFTKTFRTARSAFLGRPGAFPDLRALFPKYEYLVLDG